MANELNHALRNIPIIEEHKDTWKIPSIEESRIFTAYFETRPEVVLNENINLFFGTSAWALVSDKKIKYSTKKIYLYLRKKSSQNILFIYLFFLSEIQKHNNFFF